MLRRSHEISFQKPPCREPKPRILIPFCPSRHVCLLFSNACHLVRIVTVAQQVIQGRFHTAPNSGSTPHLLALGQTLCLISDLQICGWPFWKSEAVMMQKGHKGTLHYITKIGGAHRKGNVLQMATLKCALV